MSGRNSRCPRRQALRQTQLGSDLPDELRRRQKAIESAEEAGLEPPDLEPLAAEAMLRRGLARKADGTSTRKTQRNFTGPDSHLMQSGGFYLQGIHPSIRLVFGAACEVEHPFQGPFPPRQRMLGISLLTPATVAGAIGTEQKLVEVGAEIALDLGDVFPGRQLHIAAAVATIATMLVNTGLLPAGFQGQPGLRRT